jgi:hypothetical protein
LATLRCVPSAAILVTDPDGRLIGIAYRDDADPVLCKTGDSSNK